MHNQDNIVIHGNVTNSQIGLILQECALTIQGHENLQVRKHLDVIHQKIEELLPQLEPAAREVAMENLQLLLKGVQKKNRSWFDVSAQGLIDAAKFVKSFGSEIYSSVQALALHLWPQESGF